MVLVPLHLFRQSSSLLVHFIGVTKMAVGWQDLLRALLALAPLTSLEILVHPTSRSLDCGRRESQRQALGVGLKPATSVAFRLYTIFTTKGGSV